MRFLWFFLIGLVVASAASAQTRGRPSDREIADYFDRQVRAEMTELGIPGGALAVVRDGRVILVRGYGFADVASRRPVDVDRTLFRAASISKLLPWLAVMQLVEEGKLDLDADINRYLDFKIRYKFGRPITMRDLMTHSAGFPERFHGVFDQDLSTPLGLMLKRNIPAQVYPPGQTISYSNSGAALAGYIVQRLRRKPWEQVVTDQLFRPIGMTSSTVLQPVPRRDQARLASTYIGGSSAPAPFRVTPLAPMGSLTPTPVDMARLLTMLANNGRGMSGQVVSPSTLASMFKLQRALGPGLPDGMGLGFLVGQYHGVHFAGHAGNMSSLATDLEVLPDSGLGYYYVFNSQGPGEAARKFREKLLFATIDRFGGGRAEPVRARLPSSAPDIAGSWISTRRLAGGPLWFSGLFNTTDVTANRDGSVDIESAGEVTHWLPDGHDRFRDAETGIPLAIARSASGHPVRLGSARLYPAAEFEPQPSIARVVPFVAIFSFGILLLAVVVRPIVWLVRRRRRQSNSAETAAETNRWSGRAFWFLIGTLVLWGGVAMTAAFDFSIILAFPAILRIGLAMLTMLTAAWAAILSIQAVRGWRLKRGAIIVNSSRTVLALAALGVAGLLYGLNVINPTTAW